MGVHAVIPSRNADSGSAVRPHAHGDVITTRGDVTAAVLNGRDGIDDALALLDRAESAAGVPLVDESERHRLQALAEERLERPDHWHSLLARRDGAALGYAGVVLDGDGASATGDASATADVALDREGTPTEPVLTVLLESLRALAGTHGAERLRVWLRHASAHDVACAANDGFSIDRRLGVLGVDLADPPEVASPPDDVTIRPFVDDDASQVVEVLAAAYAGTPDSGWDRAQFDDRRAMPWYRDEDLLVAERGDRLDGLHWTKRRGGDVGEVYNLAVRPESHGHRLGAALLEAGLAHLHDVGCRRVLLWVDLSNERALRLYVSHGFTTQWEDLALGRTLSAG